MTEGPASWLRGPPIPVPRAIVALLLAAVLLLIVSRIASSPVVTLQRLDSPDGARSAVLQRKHYMQHHLQVRIRDGALRFVPYTSPPYTNDFRVDLGERLMWSAEGERLSLRIGGSEVWEYDFRKQAGRDLDPADRW